MEKAVLQPKESKEGIMEREELEQIIERKMQEIRSILHDLTHELIREIYAKQLSVPPNTSRIISEQYRELTDEDWKQIFSWRCKHPSSLIRAHFFHQRNTVTHEYFATLGHRLGSSAEALVLLFNTRLAQNRPYRVQKIIFCMQIIYKIVKKQE